MNRMMIIIALLFGSAPSVVSAESPEYFTIFGGDTRNTQWVLHIATGFDYTSMGIGLLDSKGADLGFRARMVHRKRLFGYGFYMPVRFRFVATGRFSMGLGLESGVEMRNVKFRGNYTWLKLVPNWMMGFHSESGKFIWHLHLQWHLRAQVFPYFEEGMDIMLMMGFEIGIKPTFNMYFQWGAGPVLQKFDYPKARVEVVMGFAFSLDKGKRNQQ